MDVLLIPEKYDIERAKVAEAWLEMDGKVIKVAKFWQRPQLPLDAKISLYGHDTFCLVLAQILNIDLISPKDELIAAIDKKYTKRTIILDKLDNCSELIFEAFVKPVTPKLFPAKIYQNIDDLNASTKDLEPDTRILVSEIINIQAEIRAFILDGKNLDLAVYEGDVNLDNARTFINDFLNTYKESLPITFVLDIGYNQNDGWFVIEFNASWGAGLNGCDATNIIKAIRAASISLD